MLFEDLGVHWDFNFESGSSVGSVRVHSLTLSYTLGSMRCDFRASFLVLTLVSPCLGCKLKARVATLEALIGACLKLESFVVDFVASTSMYCYKHCIVALDFHSKISSNILFLLGNSALACCNLGWHILAFDGDQKVFDKVLCPIFQDKGSQCKKLPKCFLDLESLIHKRSKIDLDYA